mmetsp:Transcript_23726/g.94097  ORF Transcript_23726/g.94097 Transcript_23726/m.94097 type:complete len:266 (-) Transcript_23726:385-1182(-)
MVEWPLSCTEVGESRRETAAHVLKKSRSSHRHVQKTATGAERRWSVSAPSHAASSSDCGYKSRFSPTATMPSTHATMATSSQSGFSREETGLLGADDGDCAVSLRAVGAASSGGLSGATAVVVVGVVDSGAGGFVEGCASPFPEEAAPGTVSTSDGPRGAAPASQGGRGSGASAPLLGRAARPGARDALVGRSHLRGGVSSSCTSAEIAPQCAQTQSRDLIASARRSSGRHWSAPIAESAGVGKNATRASRMVRMPHAGCQCSGW